MIIKIKGADFSANNIGKVNLPIENETANTMLAHLTEGVYSEARKTAFANFIQSLEDENMLDSLIYLNVPSLAKNMSDAFTNLVDGSVANNVSTASRYHLGKYGSYVDKDTTKGTVPIIADAHYTDGFKVTLGIASIYKRVEEKYMCGVYEMTIGQYTRYPVTEPRTNVVGVNTRVNVATSLTLSDETLILIGNGIRKYPSGTFTISTASTLANKIYFGGDKNLSNNNVLNAGMACMHILFNRDFSEAEALTLDRLMKEYTTAIYENDISSVEMV